MKWPLKCFFCAYLLTSVYAALLTGWIAHDYLQYVTVTSAVSEMPGVNSKVTNHGK